MLLHVHIYADANIVMPAGVISTSYFGHVILQRSPMIDFVAELTQFNLQPHLANIKPTCTHIHAQ